jgi:hypothetical protein
VLTPDHVCIIKAFCCEKRGVEKEKKTPSSLGLMAKSNKGKSINIMCLLHYLKGNKSSRILEACLRRVAVLSEL